MNNNIFTPAFLTTARWNLDAGGTFWTQFKINDKFHFSIITGGTAKATPGSSFEVALFHTESQDIVTVRHWQDAEQITEWAQAVIDQNF
jgi:hypothetical protein